MENTVNQPKLPLDGDYVNPFKDFAPIIATYNELISAGEAVIVEIFRKADSKEYYDENSTVLYDIYGMANKMLGEVPRETLLERVYPYENSYVDLCLILGTMAKMFPASPLLLEAYKEHFIPYLRGYRTQLLLFLLKHNF